MFFLEFSCFSYDPTNVENLISGSSAFSKSSLNIWKFSVHIRLKLGLENFEHYFASVWEECNCVVVWTFFGIALLWDWNENWPFPVLWPLMSFPNLLAILSVALSQHHLFRFEIAQLEFDHLHLALFIVMLPKARLTLQSRISDSKWLIIPSWLSGSWRSFSFLIVLCILGNVNGEIQYASCSPSRRNQFYLVRTSTKS